jgi:hypothetical protein
MKQPEWLRLSPSSGIFTPKIYICANEKRWERFMFQRDAMPRSRVGNGRSGQFEAKKSFGYD